MKKVLCFLIMLIIVPVNVFAAGGSFSAPGSLSVNVSKTTSLTIKANNCAGKFDISSSDPSIAKVSSSSIWLDNNSETITVTGVKAGTVTITISPTDVTDYDENTVSGKKSVRVTVSSPTTTRKTVSTTAKPYTTKRTTTKKVEVTTRLLTSTIATTHTTFMTTETPATTTERTQTTYDASLLLDELLIDGFEVSYKNGIYYSTVNQDTESVVVRAKAKPNLIVKGDGYRKLSPGVNSVELKIVDRNNNEQSVFLIITRPDGDGKMASKLAELKLIGYDIKFDPNTFEYNVTVPKNTNDVYVVAVPVDSEAVVTGSGMTYLKETTTDINITVSTGEYGSNTYVIHITKKDSKMLFILIGIFTISIMGALIYLISHKNNWIAKTQKEKDMILANEKQVGNEEDILINGNSRKIGERIIKPTVVNAIETNPNQNENVVKVEPISQEVKVTTVKPVTQEVKVATARPVNTVVVHPEVVPTVVKKVAVSNPQIKVVSTGDTNEKNVLEDQITTTIHFD